MNVESLLNILSTVIASSTCIYNAKKIERTMCLQARVYDLIISNKTVE